MANINILSDARTAVTRHGLFRLLLLVVVLLLVPSPVPAQPSVAEEYQVKAAYLVKFTQYITWPTNTFAKRKTPIIIGVLGAEPLFKQLQVEVAVPRGTNARPIKVRQVATVEEAAACQVVFIGTADTVPEAPTRNEAQWLEALKGKPILTVGESDRSIERGAVIRFVIKKKSIRFEANLNSAKENRLELDERLLAVAAKVYKPAR